ncbi:MAG: DUF302 domain-containing protein [Pseudomonadota bacterium]
MAAAVAVVLAAGLGLSVPAVAETELPDNFKTRDGAYEEVVQDLKDAIVNRGFVIDHVGYVGKMLDRTSDAVGATSPYLHAQYMQFCSAKLTHDLAAADPSNMEGCPYLVFAYEERAKPGTVILGYRKPPVGRSEASRAAIGAIEALLVDVVDQVAGGGF